MCSVRAGEPVNRHFDVIIVGAGAAGLMCAMEAGKRGRRVLVVEKAGRAGNKIRISGGGKSNFTNLDVSPENYLSQNPHFCKSALARYTQWDFMALMSEHGLTWEEREHGQLFCEQGAQAIVDMLLDECARAGVGLCYDCEILALDRQAGFTLQTSRGDFSCDSLVIATGGPSIPRMGSTDFGVQVAKRFGLKSIPFRPALVPFTFPFGFLRDLAGISLEAEVSCNGAVFREQLLITHRGLSGPVILQVSSYWNKGDAISIDLLPGLDAADWLRAEQGARPNIRLKTLLSEKLPRRLAQALCEQLFDDGPLQQFQQKRLQETGATLNTWRLVPSGTEGMRTAEVATGGVDTNELSSRTLVSRKVPGLYFIGETVDVTGHLGGYNFQWAWASGWCAGQFV
ncbi:MAG TPA: NAD(P)/FAD-dependent oxidoreductase [Thiolapillus brandeum]|uniref:NAD(P)/FAD-dependent oxidoreductase n=1 Tax=Thiolapillus brandeum TaxID=1076588 RepID=A0A831RXH2_9GAMM|nr:NAD(P)/FAD-dependent oxidoreductase [Thiolapillus brandeum]